MGAASCELRVKSTSGTPLPSRPGPLLEAELSSTLPAALMHSTGSSWRKIYASRVLRAPSPPAAPAAHRWHAGRSRGGGDLSRELLMPARTAPAASSLRRGSRPPRAPPSCPGSRGSAARGARAPASPRRQRPPRAAGAGLGGRLLEGGKRCGGRRGCQRREGPASMLTSRARGPGRLAAALARARAARDPLALVGAGRPAGDALRLCVARLVAHGCATGRLHSGQHGDPEGLGDTPDRRPVDRARLGAGLSAGDEPPHLGQVSEGGQEAAVSGSRSPQGLRILRIPSGPRTLGPGMAPPWATLRGRPRAILGVEGCLGAGAALAASAHAKAGLGRCSRTEERTSPTKLAIPALPGVGILQCCAECFAPTGRRQAPSGWEYNASPKC